MMFSTFIREPFNTLSHGIGAIGAILGFIILLILSSTWIQYLSTSLYGFTLVLLYTSSTLYHGLNLNERFARWLHRLDHASIFCLIAGTTTPVALLSLGGWNGWTLFGLLWGCALMGIIFTLFTTSPPNFLRVTFYLIMGWLSLIFIGPLLQALSTAGIAWIVTGGALYSVGALVYLFEWPRIVPGSFESHELWHLFVLAGSGSHFYFISVYTL